MKTVPGPTDHVVVVGAGLAGLAAALHLLGAGRSVTVVERAPEPGGRAGRADMGGYAIDTGPTVLTMPHLADEAFAAVGDSLARRVELIELHPAYRAQFADGSALDVHTGAEAMEEEIRRFAGPGEAAGYRRLRHWLQALYRAQMRRFIDTNFDSPLHAQRGQGPARNATGTPGQVILPGQAEDCRGHPDDDHRHGEQPQSMGVTEVSPPVVSGRAPARRPRRWTSVHRI